MGVAYHADPLRRSLTGALTVVLAAMTLAAGAYFAFSATRDVADPRPDMLAMMDGLTLPAGAEMLHERTLGGVTCNDTGCPRVERWWTLPTPVAEACPDLRAAIGAWGGIRFQRLGTADCGYLGVFGQDRLSFSVADATQARLPADVQPGDAVSIIQVSLTRD